MAALDAGAGRLRLPRQAIQMRGVSAVSAIGLSCAVTLVVHALARAATYDAWVDGSAGEYARGALFALLIATGAWIIVRAAVPSRAVGWRLLPWLAALSVLAPDDAVHLLRARHPVAVTGELVIEDGFDRGSQVSPGTWLVELRGGSVAMSDGQAIISSPPNTAAFLDLVSPPDAETGEIVLPRGAFGQDYEENLEWRAALTVAKAFSVMVQTRHVLVQGTPFGLTVTYTDPQGGTSEYQLDAPSIPAGMAHNYRLERSDGVVRLRVDDASGWAMPDAGRFGFVRFGETQGDVFHGGVLVLDRVRYVRRFPAAWSADH
ncbi:MAG TPA: hypothetical protein VFG86_09935 [Chloroflexota bacterium]|jgi:hypothetical protein|nr:hypothetical protein [Chloroflexota bacterium]